MKILALLLLITSPVLGQDSSSPYAARPNILRPGGFLIYLNTESPLSFLSMTPKELPPGSQILGEVAGRSCQHGLSIPLGIPIRAQKISGAKGKGGFNAALKDLHKKHPGLTGIFDVKIDNHIISILGIYRRLCTEITARGFRMAGQSPPPVRQHSRPPPVIY